MKRRRSNQLFPGLLLSGAVLFSGGAVWAWERPAQSLPNQRHPSAAQTIAAEAADARAEQEAWTKGQEVALRIREEQVKEKEEQAGELLNELQAEHRSLDVIKRTANLYAAMPPFKAAPLMQGLEAAVAAQILRILDEDQAAALLTYMDARQSALVMAEFMNGPAPVR